MAALYCAQSQNCKIQGNVWKTTSRWAKQPFNYVWIECCSLSCVGFPLGECTCTRKCCHFLQHPQKCLNRIVLSLAVSCHTSSVVPWNPEVKLIPSACGTVQCTDRPSHLPRPVPTLLGQWRGPSLAKDVLNVIYWSIYLLADCVWLDLCVFIYLSLSHRSVVFIFGDTRSIFCN